MKEQIEKVLADVAARYNDRRLHVCNLRADVDEEGAVKIAGRVLEASYIEAIRQSLPPGLQVAGYDVTVLREKTRTMTVATNLTDLHVEPSFLSEMLTQVMNGVELEVLEEKDKRHVQALMKDVHEQFIGAVREGRGERLKETPDMFSGLIWTGQKSVELGLADGIGSLESVARDVVKAEEIVDFTQKENFAEKFARRFGASAASAVLELALRHSPAIR